MEHCGLCLLKTIYCTISINLEKLKLKLLYLPNGEHDEVYVGEVVSQPEVAPLPLGDGGLVEVGEGQLVPQVPDQLGPGKEGEFQSLLNPPKKRLPRPPLFSGPIATSPKKAAERYTGLSLIKAPRQ